MDYMERYNKWLNNPYIDESTKKELMEIESDKKEIEERFYKDLEFGTGGIRGILGAGDNRMNIYTVSKATQGLANYIKKNPDKTKEGVAIAYDSRFMSQEFADITARVLSQSGIKSYVFPSLRPTPMLSFAIRHLNCIAGIVITASHNPPEYNGYKVYWSDGAQIPYPVDGFVIDEVNKITAYEDAKAMDGEEAKAQGLYNIISDKVDDEYIKNVLEQIVNPDIIKEMADKISIVFTPIHGSGNIPVKEALTKAGFKNLHIVKEQEEPDPNFTTVGYPNPEDPKVFELAIKLAEKVGADIIVGTDPDADRVGAVVKNSNGDYVVLSGNMTGLLLTEYILSQKKEQGNLPEKGAVVSTIVSSNMTKLISKEYNVEYFETLTGFKYIGEKIKQFEERNSNEFLFGFEESYGCLAGTYARDKDAVVATLLICEMAAFYKKNGETLYDGLQKLYKKYGYHKDSIEAMTLKGIEGIETMKKILKNLRENPLKEVNGAKTVEVRDYKTKVILDVVTGKTFETTVPVSDVLYYVLEDDTWFCIRPSGTEPKIKIYFGVKGNSQQEVDEKMKNVIEDTLKKVMV